MKTSKLNKGNYCYIIINKKTKVHYSSIFREYNINYSSIFMEHNNTLETYETRGFCPGSEGDFVQPCKNMKGIMSTHEGDFVRVGEGDFVRRGLCLTFVALIPT